MRFKRPYVASLDQVRISCENDNAIIEYADSTIPTTCLKLGPEVDSMTDREILERFNEYIAARNQLAAEYDHVAVEIPPGKPQIEYFGRGYNWVPRGDVLRCVI